MVHLVLNVVVVIIIIIAVIFIVVVVVVVAAAAAVFISTITGFFCQPGNKLPKTFPTSKI